MHLIKYRFRAETIFYHFLKKGMDIELLEQSLKDLEGFIRDSEGFPKDAGLWFRLFDSDSGCHTIADIISGLKSPAKNKFYVVSLKNCIGLNVNAELQVYFFET
jgi:hypothetical protein